MARWSPLSGVVFVALSAVAFALRSGAPLDDDSDTTILDYFNSSGHRNRDIAAFLCALAAALFFVWFLSALCTRLARAEGEVGGLTAAAFGAGLISATLWLAAKALLISSSAASSTSEYQLDPNTFRILNDVGFIFWISGTTIAAVTVIATALVSLGAAAEMARLAEPPRRGDDAPRGPRFLLPELARLGARREHRPDMEARDP
jgi:hypothetical protein